MPTIVIDPISRIEGHLSVEMEVEGGKVRDARVRGDMFRGFEKIMCGRNPVDAIQLSQRICGVCPVSHGIASCRCLESAFGMRPNRNGRLLRNLALASNFLQSHILHFYHLTALDFIDVTAVLSYEGADEKLGAIKAWVESELREKKGRDDEITAGAPFLPRYEGEGMYIGDPALNIAAVSHYVKALDLRLKAHRMTALFGGRVPHLIGLVPGGMTQVPTAANVAEYRAVLSEIETFVNEAYLPDVVAVAQAFPSYFSLGAYRDFLAYGEFPEDDNGGKMFFPGGTVIGGVRGTADLSRITEQVKHSRYSSPSGLHPSRGETEPLPGKENAYTWLKSPRYNGKPLEVGPLARVVVGYLSGHDGMVREVDGLLKTLGADIAALYSALGRHAARAVECKLLCARAKVWLDELEIEKPPRSTYEIPVGGEGVGLAEAPRGALGHWFTIESGRIGRYQCVVPTTWNASPRDDGGVAGPMEQALAGTPVKDDKNPVEPARVVRSFDPCIACAVHVMRDGRRAGSAQVC